MTGATPVGAPSVGAPPPPPRREAGDPGSARPGAPTAPAGHGAAGARRPPGAPDPSGRVGGLVDVFA